MDSSNNNSYIVLKNETKKPGKWIFWLIGIFVVTAVILLVLIIVLGNKKNDNKTYANEYFSLLTTGEKSKDFNGELTFDAISNEELSNIYTIPRNYGVLDAENTNYYNELVSLLGKIKDGANEDLAYLVDDSKTMLSYYFAAVALAYTNSSYKYYFENGNLNDLLSVYGYPFSMSDDDTTMNFKSTIDDLYESKNVFYESVSGTGCVVDSEIDYGCLSDLNSGAVNQIQKEISWLEYVERMQADQMLSIIVMNADSIREIVNGGSK